MVDPTVYKNRTFYKILSKRLEFLYSLCSDVRNCKMSHRLFVASLTEIHHVSPNVKFQLALRVELRLAR